MSEAEIEAGTGAEPGAAPGAAPGAETGAETGAALDARVRAIDEDRWLAARFAPAPARAALCALYAFNHEVACVREQVSQPLLGEMRLQWAREILNDIAAGRPARAQDAGLGLAELAAAADIAALSPHLDALLVARVRDLDPAPFPDMTALEAYAQASAAPLIAAALAICAPEAGSAAADGVAAAGRAWALTGLARAFRHRAAEGRTPIPLDVRKACGLSEAELADGSAPAKAQAALRPLLEAARRAHGQARARLAGAPAQAWPGFGYLALAPGYLRVMAARGADPFRSSAERPLLLRQARLIAGAATGQI